MNELLAMGAPILTILEDAHHPAYLVGGAVRDTLMGIVPHDLDIATSALPEQVIALFPHLRCIETGIRHGTVTILAPEGTMELTTFRREGLYTDHRRPDEVFFTDVLEEDLARRDFTINAMALGTTGLVDCFGGQEDLAHRLIRCVGNPTQRFQEDALRILRGLRFAACLDFELHPDTAAAIHAERHLLSLISQERISSELMRLLCGKAAGRILLEYADVIAVILPELAPAMGFEQHTPYHCYDVYTHSVKAMETLPPQPMLRLTALLHDVAKPVTFRLDRRGIGHFKGHNQRGANMADDIMRRLRIDNAQRICYTRLISMHGALLHATVADVPSILSRLGASDFFLLLHLDLADNTAKAPGRTPPPAHWIALEQCARNLIAQDACLSIAQLAVDGDDALKQGLVGVEIGDALRALLTQVMAGALKNERSVLLSALSDQKA